MNIAKAGLSEYLSTGILENKIIVILGYSDIPELRNSGILQYRNIRYSIIQEHRNIGLFGL